MVWCGKDSMKRKGERKIQERGRKERKRKKKKKKRKKKKRKNKKIGDEIAQLFFFVCFVFFFCCFGRGVPSNPTKHFLFSGSIVDGQRRDKIIKTKIIIK